MIEKQAYLILDILSFLVPFLYSFERKRMYFIQYWKAYFTAILLVGLFFIAWDSYFAYNGVWGFSQKYLIGLEWLKLPLEEWLFFILIPYSSNFIHYALLYFFPKPTLSDSGSLYLSSLLFLVSFGVAFAFADRIYTICSFGLFSLLMLLQIIFRFPYFKRYILSYLVILVPFFIVNSILTGSITEEPIVYYNNQENLGIRVGTIPIEDFFYCFSLLYSSLLLFEKLKTKSIFK